ncbi:MAG: UDP-N-acetylmuramoyl-tripeptide--D-alanyl-D-alanine ligase [Planctomycetia bacterium]|nr:UDP-N-acetylmuramoyl-tripeptide--D-alanyl-D-alanine ligase [Planctomycetia bacterium]
MQRGRDVSAEVPRIIVDDTGRALGDFARWYRHRVEALIVGVTGSVGKTTTRDMLQAVLSARHSGRSSLKNFNNEVGLPLSLLELKAGDEFGVMEMGAARIGDIRSLCQIADPEIGVITRIGPAHLATFGTLENIFQAKGELLEALPQHGFAVVCGDDEQMRGLARRAKCRVLFAGERQNNEVRATDVDFRPGRLRFRVEGQSYEMAAPARHYLTAALCALAVAREIGMEPAAIAGGLMKFAGQPGRCTVERSGEFTIIDDTYNASPLSMQAACFTLRDWPAQHQRLLVVGDMLELGDESQACHRELGACVAAASLDRLLAFGNSASYVSSAALGAGMNPHTVAECSGIEALLAVLDCWLEPGDVVLVKGSRGMRMERVVQWLKQRSAGSRQENYTPPTARAVA